MSALSLAGWLQVEDMTWLTIDDKNRGLGIARASDISFHAINSDVLSLSFVACRYESAMPWNTDRILYLPSLTTGGTVQQA